MTIAGRALELLRTKVWPWSRANPFVLLVALVAIALVVELLVIMVQRLSYPFELEWMEGGMVTHLQVILAGEPLYREPSLAFTPYVDPPVYAHVSALVARIVGVGLFAPRLVSAVSTLGTIVLVGRLVRGEGGRLIAMLVAMSFVAVGVSRSGFFMDLARVDSLCVFLFLLAFTVLRHGRATWSAAVAGVLFSAAFFTKQVALLLAIGALVGAVPSARRRAAVAGASFVATALLFFFAANLTTGGWFSYYVFTLPAAHELRWNEWGALLRAAVWEPLPLTFALALLGLVGGAFLERRIWLYVGVFGASLAGAYVTFMMRDAFINVLMPWIVLMSLVAGLGVEVVARATEGQRRWLHVALSVVVVQWLVVLYPPNEQIPSRRDRHAGPRLLQGLRGQPGPVLSLGSSWYLSMAGRPERNAHAMALIEVFNEKDPARTAKLRDEVVTAIESERYRTIVLDESMSWLPPEVNAAVRAHYRQGASVLDGDACWPRVGSRVRPLSYWHVGH